MSTLFYLLIIYYIKLLSVLFRLLQSPVIRDVEELSHQMHIHIGDV